MSATPTASGRVSSNALLWFSAFILMGLLIAQGGRLASRGASEARADLVSRVGEYTLLTTNAQSSEDIVLVLDGRGEQVFVYRIQNQKALELVRKYDLSTLFATGQRVGAGRVR